MYEEHERIGPLGGASGVGGNSSPAPWNAARRTSTNNFPLNQLHRKSRASIEHEVITRLSLGASDIVVGVGVGALSHAMPSISPIHPPPQMFRPTMSVSGANGPMSSFPNGAGAGNGGVGGSGGGGGAIVVGSVVAAGMGSEKHVHPVSLPPLTNFSELK